MKGKKKKKTMWEKYGKESRIYKLINILDNNK